MLGYPVHMIERDSWSGPEDGGYFVFDSEQARAAYVHEHTKDRHGAAPEFYVQYDYKEPLEISAESEAKFKDHKFYVDKLFVRKQVV
jgi:hypothetical protein